MSNAGWDGRCRKGKPDLEAWEMGLQERMHGVGAVLLEQLLNAGGGGYQGSRPCGPQGHPAVFVNHWSKQVLTVLRPVEVQRAYYHCPTCQAGRIPRDEALDIVGSSFTPGVQRMMSSKECEGPKELADLEVMTKQVERVSDSRLKAGRLPPASPATPTTWSS